MKRLILSFALALSVLPASARAQVDMQINIGLPVAPPMVVVQPGIQVVENYNEEVFFVGGWYWCRRGDAWYRARTPRASFVYVEPYYVPTRLAYLPPPGHYRHWDRARLREERHWWKEHEHDRRRAWRDHDARRAEWDHGHPGNGHGPGRHGPAPAPHGYPAVAPHPDRGQPVVGRPPERGHSSVLAPSSDRGQGPILNRPAQRGRESVIAPSSDRGDGDHKGHHDHR